MTSPRRPLRSRLLFMLLSVICLLPFAAGALIGADSESEDSLFKQLAVLSEVLTLIQRTYVDETSIRGLLDGALEGATDGLDSLSTFVPAEHAEAYSKGLEVGNAHSGIVLAKDRGIAFVVSVIEGSPASQAGLDTGDVIAAIDGASTRNMALWRLETVLAGAVGTELELEILRNGQSEQAKLVLASYEPPTPTLKRVEGVPVLRIPLLDEADVAPARDLLAPLEAAGDSDLILDLRGVAGGIPEAAYRLAALFAGGKLGGLSERAGEVRSFDNDLPPLWGGRMAVLVDGGTQGPAEILATVVRQSSGATLVGAPTFGLAGRRGRVDLPSGGFVVMTDALFSGPDGTPIDERLQPDEVVRQSFGSFAEGETEPEDLTLRRALELLSESVEEAA